MDKSDHAQVRTASLSIVTSALLIDTLYRIEEYVYCSHISITHDSIHQW